MIGDKESLLEEKKIQQKIDFIFIDIVIDYFSITII